MEFVAKTFSQVSRLAAQRSAGALSSINRPSANFSKPAYPTTAQANSRTEVDYEELSDLLTFDEELALIDVRSSQELDTYGSIPGAINIPLGEVKAALQLSNTDFETSFMLPKPGKNAKNLVFFARGPNASSAAVEIAHRLGFKGSRQYSGGWEDYCSKTGLPLKKSQQKPIDASRANFMDRNSFDVYKTYSY